MWNTGLSLVCTLVSFSMVCMAAPARRTSAASHQVCLLLLIALALLLVPAGATKGLSEGRKSPLETGEAGVTEVDICAAAVSAARVVVVVPVAVAVPRHRYFSSTDESDSEPSSKCSPPQANPEVASGLAAMRMYSPLVARGDDSVKQVRISSDSVMDILYDASGSSCSGPDA